MSSRTSHFLLFFFAILTSSSQSFFKGAILDSAQGQAVPYALISIYQNETLLHAKLSDSTGAFVSDPLEAGTYFLKIDALGYKLKQTPTFTLSSNTVLDLGSLTVNEDVTHLQEVVIKEAQHHDQNKIDKQIFKADQFQNAKGGTAIDVLKNMPSVSVNAEGEIRLRGATGFLVLINGKPVLTDVNTVLSQIPANSVENIEIVTAPSAKYDADGKSGIINITTKKGTDDGISFTFNAQYGLPSIDHHDNKEKPQRHGIDASLAYKKENWDLSLGGNYLRSDLAGLRDGDVYTIHENRKTAFPSLGERSFKRRNYALRGSVTYTPSKSNTFTTGFYVGQRRQFRLADINYQNIKTDLSTGQTLSTLEYFNSNLVKKQGDFSLANFDYTHTFSNKSALSISNLFEYALLDGYTKNLNIGSLDKGDTLEYVYNTGRSPLWGWRTKIDYSLPLWGGKLESGYQFRHQKQAGTYAYQEAILGTSLFKTLPEFSADIAVHNQIHGVYSQYAHKYKSLEYIAGLRYEYATRVFDADKLTNPYKLQLSNLFPSLNLLYSIRPKLKLKAGYSRRVQRSTSNELNPYPEREHSETLEQGDPQILPEFVSLYELGLINNYKAGSLFATLYHQQIDNVVNRVNSVYNDTVLNRIYTNAGNARVWGLEAGLKLDLFKWWNCYLGGNAYHYQIRGSLFQQTVAVNNGDFAYSINVNQNFALNKTLSIGLQVNFLSLRPTAQGEDSRFLSPNLSAKKTFLKGSLTATAQWQNIGLGILPSNEQRISTWGSQFYTTTNYIQEKDVLWIHLGYNFKQTKKLKLPSSEFGEKEF